MNETIMKVVYSDMFLIMEKFRGEKTIELKAVFCHDNVYKNY